MNKPVLEFSQTRVIKYSKQRYENYSMILRKFSRSVALPVLPRKSTFHQRTIVPHTACYPTLYIKTLNLHITQFLQLSKFKIVLCDILKCVLGVLGTGGGGGGTCCKKHVWNLCGMGYFSMWNRRNLHHEFVEFHAWNR